MLAPEEAMLLDRLTLSDRRVAVSPTASGVRRARTRGAGIEFHEYRPYQAGDDPRTIDWTGSQILQRLRLRLAGRSGTQRLPRARLPGRSRSIRTRTRASSDSR